jgi:toxin ParE1/3/4
MIIHSCQELADGKVSGRNYEEIDKDIFGYRVRKHIIFYRKQKGRKIEIARILHGRMDLRNRIQE